MNICHLLIDLDPRGGAQRLVSDIVLANPQCQSIITLKKPEGLLYQELVSHGVSSQEV